MCVCVYVLGGRERGPAGVGGPQTKPLNLQRFRAWGFHAALSLPDRTLAFHLRASGVPLAVAAPAPASCGLEVEARFVRLRRPEPLLRRRLPPPRPALVEVVVSLPFFSSVLPLHFPPQQECSPYSWDCG